METIKGEKIMIILLLIILIAAIYLFYKSTYSVYNKSEHKDAMPLGWHMNGRKILPFKVGLVHKHNSLHELWETRIVKTETGKYQVQCWRYNSSDWYCEDPLGWYAIDNFGFNDKANYDTLDEALKAKEEYDKKAYDWVHKDNVAEVVVGAKE